MPRNSSSGLCFDTCSILRLNRMNPIKSNPNIWGQVSEDIKTGKLFSSIMTYEEILYQDDKLSEWLEPLKDYFIQIDIEQQEDIRVLLKTYPSIVDLNRIKSNADPFLMVLAIKRNSYVLTEEKKSTIDTQVTIADICADYNLNLINIDKYIEEVRGYYES